MEGAANAFAQSKLNIEENAYGLDTISVNGGDAFQYAIVRGAAESARTWKDLITQRVSEMTPVVKVLSGREATAVFAKSFRIDNLYEAMQEEQDIFTSLD
jgi:hypothetical protein